MKRSFAFLLFCALTLPAQVDTGVITGTLTDPSGAVLADAAITIRNEATGIQTRLSSNSLGQYVFPPLQILGRTASRPSCAASEARKPKLN